MGKVYKFEDLKDEYSNSWNNMSAKPDWKDKIKNHRDKIVKNKYRYEEAVKNTDIPWYFIAIIHLLEGNASFGNQIFNGEPYDKVTKLVPIGKGPFKTWEESTEICINESGWKSISDWSIERILYFFEKHNGMGYRGKGIKSPYLFSGSNLYTSGKYVKDGPDGWDPNAISKQVGCACILKSILDPTFLNLDAPIVHKTPELNISMGDIEKNTKKLNELLLALKLNKNKDK